MYNISMIEIIGLVAAFLGSIMFIPQAWRVVKTRHTSDLSLTTQTLLLTVSILWTIYGVAKGSFPLIAVNSIIGVLTSVILAIKLHEEVFKKDT